jgi:acetyl esterase
MTLDSSVQALLEGLAAQGMRPFAELSPAQAREVVEAFAALQAPAREVARVVETHYPGPAGPQDLRIYLPNGAADAPLPVVVYVHGGGFVGGSLAVVDEPARALAADLGAVVVTVTYRKAPEHKFPAATDDTFAALRWVAGHIGEFGGDPERIAVMGDSAGGCLAAVAAQRARDEGGPRLAAQVLVYPVVDPTAQLPSRQECATGPLVSARDLDWFWEQYLRTPADANDPLAVPARAESLEGLPPTLVLTTQYEVSRDEAEAYGERLAAAGVDTEIVRFPGLVHGVYWMSGAVPRSRELHDAIVAFLSKRLAA